MNVLSWLDKFVITLTIKLLLSLKILSIDWPMFASSDLFKIFDKNSVLSLVEFSTINFNFSFFSVIIISLISSTSDKSKMPSLFASKRVPLINFSSNCVWTLFSSIRFASTKLFETSISSFFSSSVLALSEIPVSVFIDTTCSVSNKVLITSPDETLIVPTLPKLSSDKPTSVFPLGSTFILNLVPLTPRVIVGVWITIDPPWVLAIFPDSIIAKPFLIIPKNFFFVIEKAKSVIESEDVGLIITVEESSYWIVIDEKLSVTISSNRKISS